MKLLDLLVELYTIAVIVRVVLTWVNVDPQNNAFTKFLYDITEPVLNKIRGFVPLIGGLDLSPLVLIVALQILRNIL